MFIPLRHPAFHARLLLGVLVSAVLHCLLLGVAQRWPAWRALPAPPADDRAAFSLRLIRPSPKTTPAPVRILPPDSHAASTPPAGTVGRQRAPQPAARQDAALIAEAPPSPEAAAVPATIEAGAAPGSVAGIMEAARREAASLARGMNRAPGADADFRSRVQQDLDRHFDAAHDAAGSWTRAAGITDITRASDGATRIYRIATPLGAFCMTYTGGSGRPSYTTCPR
jgi:hypothetical protein